MQQQQHESGGQRQPLLVRPAMQHSHMQPPTSGARGVGNGPIVGGTGGGQYGMPRPPSTSSLSAPPPGGTLPLSTASTATGLGVHRNVSASHPFRPAPSAAQLAAASAIIGKSVPSEVQKVDDTDGYEVSDSEMEDSVVLKDGRRFPNALKEKHVTFGMLLAIVYFCVAGGPYGLEDGVLAGGLTWVSILLIVLPWTLNLPIGLLTSELASAMPQNGGYILWVSRAFGNFWGFQEGWHSWSSSLFDTALYPFLAVAYLNYFLANMCGVTLGYWALYSIRVVLCVIVCIFNLLNVQMQGTISLLFAAACLLPFALLTVLGLTSINWHTAFTHFHPISEVNWGLLLSVVLWVGSGWDSPGTVAGDVKTPKKTYPRAVTTAVALVTLTNLMPVLVAFSVNPNPTSQWATDDAFWAEVGQKLSGGWLAFIIVLVSIVGNLSLLHVLLNSTSWGMYALALPGLLDVPLLTKLQSRFRTPWVCISLNTVGLIICCLSTFEQLVQVTMALNGLATMLQCMALIWLRITEPKMKRPYRIPLSTPAVALFMLMPIAISALLLATIAEIPRYITIAFVMLGIVLFLLARLVERVQQLDSSMRPSAIDLQDVFEDVVESVEEGKPEDRLPDLGFRSSLLVEQLPESIRYDPTEVNDNFGDPDASVAEEREREKRQYDDDDEDEDEEEEEEEEEEEDEEVGTKDRGRGAVHYGSTDLHSVKEDNE